MADTMEQAISLLVLRMYRSSSPIAVLTIPHPIRSLISIPISGALVPAVGPKGFVAVLGGVLTLALLCFLIARWACLEYYWRWRVKI